MNVLKLLQWQVNGYPRYHRSRGNLLIHIIAVPLFWGASVCFILACLDLSVIAGLIAVAAMVLSIALQGRGHKLEEIPPEPFTGRSNALARIVLEQWITFPRFLLSGGWMKALRNCRRK